MEKTRFEADVSEALEALCGDMNGKAVVVALSGGADSVTLLLALNALSVVHRFKLSAIHVNHMIRGAEADRDEEFCRALCADKAVDFYSVHIDVPAIARCTGQSIELCARQQRYSAFESYCKDYGIDYIATAHNANDNAETVLYNVLRGTGLDGVCGIPKKRGNIIRPILGKTRAEILQFLSEHNQSYVTDSTNLENDYTRNYIRNVLLPSAKKINIDAVGALNKLARAATDDCTYLNTAVRRALADGKRKISDFPPAMKSRAVRSLCAESCGFVPESKHIYAICDGLTKGGEHHYSLPNGYIAVTCNGLLTFKRADGHVAVLSPAVLHEGENSFADGMVNVSLYSGSFKKPTEHSLPLTFTASFDKPSLVGNLKVHPRQTGDCYIVRGMSRNVKKCLINKKVPASLRDILPIICDDAGILFVPFIGIADRVYNNISTDTYNLTVSIERDG